MSKRTKPRLPAVPNGDAARHLLDELRTHAYRGTALVYGANELLHAANQDGDFCSDRNDAIIAGLECALETLAKITVFMDELDTALPGGRIPNIVALRPRV